MTGLIIFRYSRRLLLDVIFGLLALTPAEVTFRPRSGKCQLALPGPAKGSIVTAAYSGATRGLILKESSSFRNCITLRMSLQERYVTAKLNSTGLHLCGVASEEDGYQVVELVRQHLSFVEDFIGALVDEELLAPIIQELEELSGLPTDYYVQEDGTYLTRRHWPPSEQLFLQVTESDVRQHLLSLASEYDYIEDFILLLYLIQERQSIFPQPDNDDDEEEPPPLEVAGIISRTLTRNYSLKQTISRVKVSRLFSQSPDFTSQYQNTTDMTVKLRRSWNGFQHTITIGKTGNVKHTVSRNYSTPLVDSTEHETEMAYTQQLMISTLQDSGYLTSSPTGENTPRQPSSISA